MRQYCDNMARPKRPPRDEAREHRIAMEIVVDASDEQERAMGWYYHLESALDFPFRGRVVRERSVSPLRKSETVDVIGLPPEDECWHEVFVTIRWKGKKRGLAVPLAQIEVIDGSDATKQAVEDWHYWIASGYQY